MLNLEYTIKQFKKQLSLDVDYATLEDLHTLCRDNFIPLKNINKYIDSLKLVSLDTMLHNFNYRTLQDILDTEAVISIGDRWLI